MFINLTDTKIMNSQNVAIIKAPLTDLHQPSYLISTIYPDNNGSFKGKGFVIFSKPDSTYELLCTENFSFSSDKSENDWFEKVKSQTVECYAQKLMEEIDNQFAVRIKGGENSSDTYKRKLKSDIYEENTEHIRKVRDAINGTVGDNTVVEELEVTAPMTESLKEICDKTNHLGLKEYLGNILATEN